MPGGKIAPDGRPAQAPGVGKDSKRHDLEAPATPGLHGSDLQQGDVQMLEQGQQVAPRPKRTQPSAQPRPARGVSQRSPQPPSPSAAEPMQIPSGLESAKSRLGRGSGSPSLGGGRHADPTAWLPLIEQMALTPNNGGAVYANLVNMLSAYRRRPVISQSILISMTEMDKQVEKGF